MRAKESQAAALLLVIRHNTPEKNAVPAIEFLELQIRLQAHQPLELRRMGARPGWFCAEVGFKTLLGEIRKNHLAAVEIRSGASRVFRRAVPFCSVLFLYLYLYLVWEVVRSRSGLARVLILIFEDVRVNDGEYLVLGMAQQPRFSTVFDEIFSGLRCSWPPAEQNFFFFGEKLEQLSECFWLGAQERAPLFYRE